MNFLLRRRAAPSSNSRRVRGFSLLEMMIAISLGLVALVAMMSVYLSSKTAFRRAEELGALQNGARTAFEYIGFDARSAGMLGCQSGGDTIPPYASTSLLNNYLAPVEGFNATAAPSFSLTGVQTVSQWATNTAIATSNGSSASIVFNATGTGIPNDIAAGSDVLILRGPSIGVPLRLQSTLTLPGTALSVETTTEGGGACASGVPKSTCFSAGSHALVTNCTTARLVSVATATTAAAVTSLTLSGTGLTGAPTFAFDNTEVFPLQTVMYYVAPSLNNATTLSLYRHVFSGNANAGQRMELIEGVENLQVLYGEDNATANSDASPDYTVDVYRVASAVAKWRDVRSVRLSLLMRSLNRLSPGVSSAANGTLLDGTFAVSASYPDTNFDRRVFTTTITLRNQVPFKNAP